MTLAGMQSLADMDKRKSQITRTVQKSVAGRRAAASAAAFDVQREYFSRRSREENEK